jgi:hypothetical protein
MLIPEVLSDALQSQGSLVLESGGNLTFVSKRLQPSGAEDDGLVASVRSEVSRAWRSVAPKHS